MRIILIGPPGAGKGTQSRFITETLQIPAIATGDMLRAAVGAGSAIGQKIAAIMDSGALVSDDIIVELVKARTAEPDCQRGFLFDGFPRTIAQADALREQQIKIDCVIHFDVADDAIVERISGRLVHAASGRVYHRQHNPPKNTDIDDVTGEPLEQRADDQEAVVRQRLSVYHQQTKPLIDYYREWSASGDELAPHYESLSGMGAVEEIKKKISAILTQLSC